ncbi:MAG: S8 family serine peptidase, partial [Holophagales bacterium]|nr:S8 family serine peptidase [Holophagales bacterium]
HTLSVPGTARTLIAVSSIEAADPLVAASSSALGPTRDGRQKPDLCAPGVGIRAAKGGTADDVLVWSGTSMAAPHVAGALALLLSRRQKTAPAHLQLNAAQARAVVRNTSRPFSGAWSSAVGYGSLDTEALLNYQL